jgi:CheY-like chemotaxis protein
MTRIRLIHWNAAEAAEKAALLEAAGYRVEFENPGPEILREMRSDPPAAVVIDLGRLPSHGREIGAALRQSKATRFVPLVFAGGEPAKVAKVRELLPDAVFTEWRGIRAALKRALSAKPKAVATPPVIGYSGTPLPKKLGIKPTSLVSLVAAPDGFEDLLADRPEGARLVRKKNPKSDLILWFVTSRAELHRGIQRMAAIPDKAGLWIAWPKKTSRLAGDLGERDVRETGLANGLVDYKICAIDDTWSGLKFARRQGG